MGIQRAEQTIEIAASPHACFEVITDYETFPDWQQAVKRTEVLTRDRKGRGRRVKQFIDAKFREVTYTLEYSYEEPSRIWWDFVEGDVKAIEGEYLLDPIEPHPSSDSGLSVHTEAVYRLGIDPGVPLPGPIARRLNGEVMRRAATDLKTETERRTATRQ